MRPQEMGALTWDDVDLTARTLDLNKVINGIHAASEEGIKVKINTVLTQNFNEEDELTHDSDVNNAGAESHNDIHDEPHLLAQCHSCQDVSSSINEIQIQKKSREVIAFLGKTSNLI